MQRCFKVLELYKSRQVFGSFYTLNWYFWFPLNSHCISIWFFFFLSIFLGDRNKMGLWKHTRTEEFILGDSTGVTVPFAFCMWYTAPDSCLVISSYRWWNRHSRMLSLLVVITRKCLQKKKGFRADWADKLCLSWWSHVKLYSWEGKSWLQMF